MKDGSGLKWLSVASVVGMVAVIAGAFGAHALEKRLAPEDLQIFETGARYQMYHALAMVASAWMCTRFPSRLARGSAIAFLIGIIIFSGSLYALTLLDVRWLGAITPIGGVSLMIGWLLLAIAAARAAGHAKKEPA